MAKQLPEMTAELPADVLFNDLTDVQTMLVCVTGEGIDAFSTLSAAMQENYLMAMQRRVDSALAAFKDLRNQ